MTLANLQQSLEIPAYTDIGAEAVQKINDSPSPFKVRGINSPAFVLLYSQAFVSQMLLESFKQLTPLLGLRLIESAGVERQAAAAASGQVTVEVDVRTAVSSSRIISPNGVEYLQESAPTVLIPGTPATLTYTATQTGSIGNQPASSDMDAEGWGTDIDFSLASTLGFTGGKDAESDEDLINRGQFLLASRGVPINTQDWASLARVLMLGTDSSALPQVRVWPTFIKEVFDDAYLTRPAVQIELAKQPNLPASLGDCASIQTQLNNVGLIHTRVSVVPAVIVNINAEVIVQYEASISANQLGNNIEQVISEYVTSCFQSGIIQQRLLLSKLARLAGVVVIEDVWLGTDLVAARPDNLQVQGLPYLLQLTLRLVDSTGAVTLQNRVRS